MANKRLLKKQIKMICGDLAAESITAMHLIPNADKDKFKDVVIKVATLQTNTLECTNIAFDKTPRQFNSLAEYRKAHREYFKKAYTSMKESFNKEVETILHEMNSALPKK